MPKEAAIALRGAFGQLRPGSFHPSVDLFGPAKVAEACSWLPVHVPRGLAGENEFITIGFCESWPAELVRSQDELDERQKAARAPLVEEVILRDTYEIAVSRLVDGEAL